MIQLIFLILLFGIVYIVLEFGTRGEGDPLGPYE